MWVIITLLKDTGAIEVPVDHRPRRCSATDATTMARNVLEEWFGLAVAAVKAYGWYAVAAAIVLYFSWPRITAFRKDLSLREANDPTRRKVLDAQRMKVRLQQQKALDHVD